LKKIILFTLFLFLIGCSNKVEKETTDRQDKQEEKDNTCVYIDFDKGTISIDEATYSVSQVLSVEEKEKYLIDFVGLEKYNNRIYYYIFLVLDTPEERRTINRYIVDVYTMGEVFISAGADWTKPN
jgi:hypothetical protein